MTDTTTAEALASGKQPKELHLGWALVLISMAQLMVVLDGTIVNIALPWIQADLDISNANLTWVVTGYALAFGSLLLLGGRLGDLYGRRRVFTIGLTIFGIASLLGGLATNEGMLLARRGLQGLGAALASPAALALIATTFPAGPQRNRAFAVYAAMSGAGAAVGLILGGWLTGLDLSVSGQDFSGWRLTLLINTPIGIAAAMLAPRFLRESESHPGQLDLPGAVTGTLGLLGLVYGLQPRRRAYGWSDPWTIASLSAGLVILAAFLYIESRVEHPLLPLADLHQPDPRGQLRGDVPGTGRDVRDVLLPEPAHPERHRLQPAARGRRVPAVRARHRRLGCRAGLQPDQPVRPALPGRCRHLAGGVGTLRVLPAAVRRHVLRSATDVAGRPNYATHPPVRHDSMALGMGMVFVPLTLTAVHHLRSEDSGIGSGVLNTMQQVRWCDRAGTPRRRPPRRSRSAGT